MEADDVAERARQRELVRRGYDAISVAYRSDDGAARGTASSRKETSDTVSSWPERPGGIVSSVLVRPGGRAWCR